MAAGISFRETMEGWFALGAQAPEEGALQGQSAGHKLAMHAEVQVDDLELFLAQRKETGRLSGTIEFPPLGERLEARSGVFQLFTPATNDGIRRMVYELAFQAQGKPYYLAGEKHVRDDPGFDMWSDTTTLYTRLHEGGDKQGKVVGAGILTLGVPELIAMVGSMRALGGGGMGTVMRFGSFFLGQLWNTYAPHVVGGKSGA
ncbi:MAG: hypothetical protein ACRETN_02630 [Nevskiales bacterium]